MLIFKEKNMKNFRLILMAVTSLSIGLIAIDPIGTGGEVIEVNRVETVNSEVLDDLNANNQVESFDTAVSDASAHDINVNVTSEKKSEMSDKKIVSLEEVKGKFNEFLSTAQASFFTNFYQKVDETKEISKLKFNELLVKAKKSKDDFSIQFKESMSQTRNFMKLKGSEIANKGKDKIIATFQDFKDRSNEKLEDKSLDDKDDSSKVIDEQQKNNEVDNSKSFMMNVVNYVQDHPGMTSVVSAVTVITIGMASLYVCKQYDDEDQDTDIENN